MNVPAIRRREPELCPPRAALESYARGVRDPQLAGHISRCDRCAWTVTEAMEAQSVHAPSEVIDITPRPSFWRRLVGFAFRLRSGFAFRLRSAKFRVYTVQKPVEHRDERRFPE
jgi:hypothetical protein